jgi:beta-phosphoglucomutase-like phosphatase (HAD superfamily)
MTVVSGNRCVLIFDYDGGLANTEPLHWDSWNKLLVPFQIELTWEQYCRHCRGVADTRIRSALIEMSPQSISLPDLAPNLAARKREVLKSSLIPTRISAKHAGNAATAGGLTLMLGHLG